MPVTASSLRQDIYRLLDKVLETGIPLEPVQAVVSYIDITFTLVEHAFLLLFAIWWLVKRRKRAIRGL